MANRKIPNSKYDIQLEWFSFHLEVTFHSMITKGKQSLHQCHWKQKKDMVYSEELSKEKLRKISMK